MYTHFDLIINQYFNPTATNKYGDVRHTGKYETDYMGKKGDSFETWLTADCFRVTRTLKLTLKRKWFDKFKAGRKIYEFREIKPWTTSRLLGKEYDFIQFKAGYQSDAETIAFQYLGYEIRTVKGVKLYAIRTGRLIR